MKRLNALRQDWAPKSGRRSYRPPLLLGGAALLGLALWLAKGT